MRIVHVNNIANVAPTLVEGLQNLGQDATFRDLRRIGKDSILPLKWTLSPLRLLEYASLTYFIRNHSVDIVHIHYASQGLAGLLGRFPFLLHVHGTDVHQNLRFPFISAITRMAMEHAEMVFFSTPNLEPLIHPLREDAIFLPNPVRIQDEVPERPSELRDPHVLLFMRLDPIKIHKEYLVRLAKLSVEKGIKISAIRWGKWTSFVEREFPEIDLVPMKQHHEIKEFINGYDIIIGQQIQGALGMSELEAMAVGKPLLVNFQYPDIYPDPPPVLNTTSIDELITTLLDLIRHPEKAKQMGARGRNWVSTYHSLEKVSAQLQEYYQRVINNR